MGILPDSLDIFRCSPLPSRRVATLVMMPGASSAQNVAILCRPPWRPTRQTPFSRCLRRCSTAVSGPRAHRQADQAISVDPVCPPLGEHARVATPVRKRGPVCRRCGGRARDVLVDEGLGATAGGGVLAAPAARGGLRAFAIGVV